MTTESGNYEGKGATIEEAVQVAHKKMTEGSVRSDEHFKSRVTAFGFESGTIAGLHRYWATVTKIMM